MPIKTRCPICGALKDVSDAREGKTVRCSKCEETFTARPVRSRSSRDDDDRAPRRGRARDDEDEDERPRRRRAPKSSGAATVLLVLGGVAAGLLLVCGGGGLWLYFSIKSTVNEFQAQMQAAPAPAPAVVPPPPALVPPPVVPPPPPVPPRVQPPQGIQNVDAALAGLKAGKDMARRGEAAAWLAGAAPSGAQRPRVVAALDGLLTDALALDGADFDRLLESGKTPRWAAEQALAAVVRWAGKDDLPALEHAVKLLPRWANPPAGTEGICDALGRTGDERAVTLLIDVARRQRLFQAAQAIKRLGPAGESGLRKALDDPDPEVQAVLPRLWALAGLKDSYKLVRFLNDLRSGDRQRRLAAADALSRMPADDARREEVSGLLRPLTDVNDAVLRDAARHALIRWAPRSDVATLLSVLNARDATDGQRQAAIEALGATRDPEALGALAGLVGGRDSFWAEKALVLAGPAAEAAVRPLLDSPDAQVRGAADRLLRRLAGGGKPSRNVPTVTGGKNPADFDKAWADAHADEARQRNAGLIALANGVPVPDDKKPALLELVDKLRDDADANTRHLATLLLTKYATKEQAPALLKLLEGQAGGLRVNVMLALGRLKEEKAIPQIVKSLGVPNEHAFAEASLAQMGPACEKAVLEELKGGTPATRLACARVLRRVGTRDSLPALEEIAKDTDAGHKELAAEAARAVQAIKKRP